MKFSNVVNAGQNHLWGIYSWIQLVERKCLAFINCILAALFFFSTIYFFFDIRLCAYLCRHFVDTMFFTLCLQWVCV